MKGKGVKGNDFLELQNSSLYGAEGSLRAKHRGKKAFILPLSIIKKQDK